MRAYWKIKVKGRLAEKKYIREFKILRPQMQGGKRHITVKWTRSPSDGASISINFLSQPFPRGFINRTIFFCNALAACCHFSIFIGSFLYQRAKPPQGIVLFVNLLGKGLTPRACMGDADSIWWVPDRKNMFGFQKPVFYLENIFNIKTNTYGQERRLNTSLRNFNNWSGRIYVLVS